MPGAYADGYCLAFAATASDAVNAHTGVFKYRACTPNGVTRGQTRDIVVAYLVNHPEQRHFIASSLAAYALAVAFPCK